MIDLGPPPLLIAKPAIIRPAEHALLRPGAFAPATPKERGKIIADLVRSGRLTSREAQKAFFFVPVLGGLTRLRVPVTSLSKATHATSENEDGTFACPADIIAGDLLVALSQGRWYSTGLTYGPYSGFILLKRTAPGSSNAFETSYKIADGSEASSTLTGGLQCSTWVNTVLYVFRGDVPINAVTPSIWNGQLTNSNPSAQTVSADGQATPLVVLAGWGENATGGQITTDSFTPTRDGEVGVHSWRFQTAYKIYNSSPANVTVDMNDEGDQNNMQSGYLIVE